MAQSRAVRSTPVCPPETIFRVFFWKAHIVPRKTTGKLSRHSFSCTDRRSASKTDRRRRLRILPTPDFTSLPNSSTWDAEAHPANLSFSQSGYHQSSFRFQPGSFFAGSIFIHALADGILDFFIHFLISLESVLCTVSSLCQLGSLITEP